MLLTSTKSSLSQQIIDKEAQYGAHNYHPLPVVLSRGEGVYVWDVEGKKYFDFLAGYSAVNQGHCHPKILETFIAQAHKMTLSSRAFHNEVFGEYAEFITQTFGFDKVLPMNSGAEAVETSLKLARKWGYMVKGVPENRSVILTCKDNFHGRTISIISFSSDPSATKDFGPFTPGFKEIPFNDLAALQMALKDENVIAFLVEPIQGEAGVIVPDEGYLAKAADLCKMANVLFVADEIQSGLGRTGAMLTCDHEGVKPDMLVLGKALSGGMLPVSAVLANDEIILTIKPGEHGSTFGGNPLACRVAMTAINVIMTEEMSENSRIQGAYFRESLAALHHREIKTIRGKGLFNAIVIDHPDSERAWDICLKMKDHGLIAKPTHGDRIRFTPPLTITRSQIDESIEIISKALNEE